jgi:hypothetical protein
MKPIHLITAFALCLGLTAAQAQTTLDTYALTGVTLIDANHIPGLPHQTVIIQKGKIEKIYPDKTTPFSTQPS